MWYHNNIFSLDFARSSYRLAARCRTACRSDLPDLGAARGIADLYFSLGQLVQI